MKKFYTSLAIIAVIVAHVSARFVVADSFTFSSSDYTDDLQAEPTQIALPVSYNASSSYSAKTLFINSIPADNSYLNY